MIQATKRLYDLGFAIHLLQPRSKRPVELKWTSGDRIKWSSLKASYVKGQNVGVRLGKASKVFGDSYLAVIDCDVKSSEKSDRDEMRARLKELFAKDWDSILGAPWVESGRGNGSSHIYVRTSEPVQPKRLAQSSKTVRVKIPSVKPSKRELATLSESDVANGVRLRPAWEISLMGEGQQVVLPPSIHPDSGRPYTWGPGSERAEYPRLDEFCRLLEKSCRTDSKKTLDDFKAMKADSLEFMMSRELSPKIIDLVMSGDGCEDRSAGLFTAALSMLKARFTDREILSILTDPDTYLGGTGYDHVPTTSRKRAAAWVENYTLAKARREVLAEHDFESAVGVDTVDEFEADLQASELLDLGADWQSKISRSGKDGDGPPKPTLANVILILRGEFGEKVFKKDLFAMAQLHGRDCPEWGARLGEEVNDEHVIRIKNWLANHYRFEPANDKINEAITTIAAENAFHPVRDYVEALEWDFTPRIDTWLKDYLSAEAPEPYLSAVSRKVLCAMIARVYEPGRKFDQVLILQGLQGAGKSTILRNLASDAWFSDAEINVSDKDAVMTMRSKWLIELGELSAMRAADVELLKAFVSRTEDRIRVPYGKRAENFPRQCVFIGTTNREEFLKDPTGNRRYWPVKVGACDFERLKRDRDQLIAEAKFVYDLGEPLWLEEIKARDQSVVQQESRTFQDVLAEKIADFLDKVRKEPEAERNFNPDKFTLAEAFSDYGPLADLKDTRQEQYRAAEAFRALGFEKRNARGSDSTVRKYWMPKVTLKIPLSKGKGNGDS